MSTLLFIQPPPFLFHRESCFRSVENKSTQAVWIFYALVAGVIAGECFHSAN